MIGKYDVIEEVYQNYLEVGASTKEYFENNIQRFPDVFLESSDKELKLSQPENDEEKLIRNAYDYFKSKILSLSTNSSLHEVNKSVFTGLKKLFVIRIEIEDLAMAFEIFETVNSQRVDLSVADLIKNQVFRNLANESKLKEGEETWRETMDMLDGLTTNISPKEFIRYYWAANYEYVSDTKLYDTIKKELKNDSKKWFAFLTDLHLDALFLKEIFENSLDHLRAEFGHIRKARRVNTAVEVLKNSKSKTWVVLYLALYKKRSEMEKLGLKDLDKHIEIFQKHTFMYVDLAGLPGNKYWITMYKGAQKINKANKLNEYKEALNWISTRFKEDLQIPKEQFVESFKGYQYSSKNISNLHYLLSQIELRHRPSDSDGWDKFKVSIEHFLPQKPAEWGFKAGEIKGVVNLVGNLLLIPEKLNGKLGNKPCMDKVEVMEKSTSQMFLLKTLAERVKTGEWAFNDMEVDNFDAIHVRQEYMASEAFKIWVTELKKGLKFFS